MNRGSAVTHGCDYCGLPLPGEGWTAADDPSRGNDARPLSVEPLYCCLGCQLAAAITKESGAEGQARWTLTRLGLSIFFSMNVMVFTLVLWTQDVYRASLEDGPPAADTYYQLLRYLCLLFALPVVLLLGGPLLESAWRQLRRRLGLTDLLLVLGVAAAFGYSLVSVVRGTGHVYFEVACMVLVFVTLGRWLEATGKLKTTSVLRSLEKLLPDLVRRARGDACEEVPAAEIVAGDRLRVLPGERIAVDGFVTRNQGAVDQQAVTGESQPVVKRPGDRVLSGSLNLDGDLWIEASGTAGDSTLQQVIAAVEQAALHGERHQRLADRVASGFLPAVLLIAIGTFLAHGWGHDWQAGLLAGLAVVLIACPCALGLATPMALWAALGRACQAQILFREGDALTQLATANLVCFDKTGTLTTGQAEVQALSIDPNSAPGPSDARDRALRVAEALAAGSAHVMSAAIGEFCRRELSVPRPGHDSDGKSDAASARDCFAGTPVEVNEPRSLPGRGVTAVLQPGNQRVWLGSPRWMAELRQERWEAAPQVADGSLEPAGGPRENVDELSRVCLAWGGRIRAVFALREALRPEAGQAIRQLRELGCRVLVLSGDASARVAVVGRLLDVEVQGDLLPDAKLAMIQNERKSSVVVMVGDGINDAPALAAADVGVAMGSGTDVSRQSAAVCLLGNDLLRLPWAIRFARRTVRTIRWNLLWAFGYNTVGILLAAWGLLNPIMAAAAMVGSSVLVISNSLRLTQFEVEPSTERLAGRIESQKSMAQVALPDGVMSKGAVSKGAVSNGAVSDGAVSDGAVSDGAVSEVGMSKVAGESVS